MFDKVVFFRLVPGISMGARWADAVSSHNDILGFSGLSLRGTESSGDMVGSIRYFWAIQRRWIAGPSPGGRNCKEVRQVVVVFEGSCIVFEIIVTYSKLS